MYSESEIDAAVKARLMTPQTAAHFRTFVAKSREAPAAGEEYVRLLSSFNDVFVTTALMLALLGTAALLGQIFPTPLPAFVALAGLSWAAAEYFTRRHKLALPSFLLFFSFAIAVPAAAFWALALVLRPEITSLAMAQARPPDLLWALVMSVAALGGCALHWYRFRVPVAVAVGALAGGGALIKLLHLAAPVLMLSYPHAGSFLLGLTMFVLAMWWDMSDVYRQTRRADVAFWLHLAAAVILVHSTFGLIGLSVTSDTVGVGGALVTLLLYLFFCLVALAIDRRAILVSSLIYVLTALGTTLSTSGGPSPMGLTVAAIVIGSGLLTLSVLWTRLRGDLLKLLPAGLGAQLPRADLEIAGPRPVA